MTASADCAVFHVTTAADWAATARLADAGQPVAVEQFERHGFVHCCFREQLSEIATWWFDATEDLVAVEIEPERIGPSLRLEASPSRWYPHVYGPIPAAAVRRSLPIPRESDGSACLPVKLREPPPGFQLVGRVGDGDGEARVRWRPGHLEGDDEWVGAAKAAVDRRDPVPLLGGVLVAPDLDRAYESFALLSEVAASLVRYDGDGFFEWPRH